MFNFYRRFKRRVSIKHEHGALFVHIARNNEHFLYVTMLLAFTAAFVYMTGIFVFPFFRGGSLSDAIYVLPFVAFVVLWYVVGLSFSAWRSFGVEDLALEAGTLRWDRKALWWKRTTVIRVDEIDEIVSITPWHALSNHVEIQNERECWKVGDMLMRDETEELARELAHARLA
jgi:hypothetical protein